MKLFDNDTANVEMIPKVIYLFIMAVFLYYLIMGVAPTFQVIHELSWLIDTNETFGIDPMPKFDDAVDAWFIYIGLLMGAGIFHLFVLAIKRQRYTDESDFR